MLVLGLVELPWWAIALLLLAAWYLYETRNFNFFKDQGVPFIRPFPLIGTMYLYKDLREGHMEVLRRYKDEGKVGGFIGNQPSLTVWDEKMLADILVKEASNFINHLNFADPHGLGSKMLFNMEDERWKTTRNEISPTFPTGKLKAMNREIHRCAKALGEYLLEQAEIGEPIEIKDVLPNVDFTPAEVRVFIEPFQKEPIEFFTNVTKQAIEIRKADDGQSRTDFLQIMVNAQKGEGVDDREDKTSTERKGLTTDEILANAVSFFQAGYDKTSSTLSFLMYCLATNPDIQNRLIEEIDSVVTDMESVAYSVLQELPYLEQCLSETLRLYPIALSTSRVAQRDTTLQGVFIKKGMTLMVPIFAMQRLPERWPDPEKFDPERFSAVNKGKRNPYHYIPFGAGPRMCLGNRLALQEMKMAAIHILKRVTVETCEKTLIPMKFESAFLLKPADLWLKIVKR